MIKLKYGNTNTYFLQGSGGGLLFDTDYAGTMQAFFRALGENSIRISDIRYLLISHYHPDHAGLAGSLMQYGVKLLLPDVQKDAVHFPDRIFARAGLPFEPVDESSAVVISCGESRNFLSGIGIRGEIIHTPSHSPDSISLILDSGDCFVGDLEPAGYIEAYEDNAALKKDWEHIASFSPGRIYCAHRPDLSVR